MLVREISNSCSNERKKKNQQTEIKYLILATCAIDFKDNMSSKTKLNLAALNIPLLSNQRKFGLVNFSENITV